MLASITNTWPPYGEGGKSIGVTVVTGVGIVAGIVTGSA
jgi:hypothetical protein